MRMTRDEVQRGGGGIRARAERSPDSVFLIPYLFKCIFYFWLHWVFVAAPGLPLVETSGGYS